MAAPGGEDDDMLSASASDDASDDSLDDDDEGGGGSGDADLAAVMALEQSLQTHPHDYNLHIQARRLRA
jgi:hypothetical protein